MTDVPRYILDASVAVKWHLHDEEFVAQALTVLRDFREGRIDLLGPDHLRYEVPSAVRNAASRQRLSSEQARIAIDQFLNWGIPTITSDDLIRAGYQQGLRYGCSLYDGLYLALAEAVRVPLVYADRRLRNGLADRFPYALWIEDYPST